MMISISTVLLSLLGLTYATSGKGVVSLYSDNSCGASSDPPTQPGPGFTFGEQDPIALNYTINADTCGVPGATVHSYLITSRPICDDGTTADWIYDSSNNCQSTFFGPRNVAFDNTKNYDGRCLALTTINSLAFTCNGVGKGSVQQGISSTGTATTSSSTAPAVSGRSSSTTSVSIKTSPTAFATPVNPSNKPTIPLYTASSSSNTTGRAPSGTSPSRSTRVPTSTTAVFTGSASQVTRSLMCVIMSMGAMLMVGMV